MNLNISDITLFMFASQDFKNEIKAFNYNMSLCNCSDYLVVSPFERPANLKDNVRYVKISKGGLDSYCSFVVSELHKHLTTKHVFIIHLDGHILNPDKWKPVFLDYDYIGSPWGSDQPYRVGNGVGIRSKKLCEETSKLNYNVNRPEDLWICRDNRLYLESLGLKWAPLELACDFGVEVGMMPSAESDIKRNLTQPFIFHGSPRNGFPTKELIEKAMNYE